MTPLPYSIETEQAVLSALLCGALFDEIDSLQPKDFYRTAHQLTFAAMVEMNRKRQPIDLVSTIEQLRSDGHIGANCKVSDVSGLVDYPAACSLQHAAKAIRGYSIRRQAPQNAMMLSQQLELVDGRRDQSGNHTDNGI